MPEISKLAELRKLLLGMERSLGLQELSRTERDIYYAANDLARTERQIRTVGLLEHTLVSEISRPTFFRALKSLVEKGYLAPSDGRRRGLYEISRKPGC